MEAINQKLRIGVVGAGVAGITAAYLLSKRHDVTLIERNDYVGGHTNTISVDDAPDRTLAIDTGFIVCNPKNYPLFYKLLAEWDVELRDSDMSFGFFCERTRLGYTGPSIRELMQRATNLLNLRFVSMILEQRRFNRRAIRDLDGGVLRTFTLGEYLKHVGASDYFVNNFLLPLSASVWSSPDSEMLNFPAETFIRFFANHCLLQLGDFPTWQTVVGGSQTYVQQFRKKFAGEIVVNAPVRAIRRTADGAIVQLCDGRSMQFDRIVLASHADESLGMLEDANAAERAALSAWTYHTNSAVLHTDRAVMPPDRKIWASWNYYRPADARADEPVPITYYMNRLQGLDSQRDYFVSLNLRDPVAAAFVIYSVTYTHPAYTSRSVAARENIRTMNGRSQTFFCGSYMGNGFHEDAVRSAVEVAEKLGVSL